MNRNTMTSRLSKLETAARITGKTHVMFVTRDDEDQAAARREIERQKVALIASGEAGADDLFVTFLTYYERDTDERPKPLAPPSSIPVRIAEPTADPARADPARQVADLEAPYEALRAPPAAVRVVDASSRPEIMKRRHAALLTAARTHPAVGH